MATAFIPASLQRLWVTWNIRGFMILSLVLQLLLALGAPIRQKTSNKFIIFFIWSAFILSDWAAIFAFGLISNAQRSDGSSRSIVAKDLLAFWSAFLLIHLGGTDSITAFSVEDNALWLRHMVGLIVQVCVFFFIFLKTLPHNSLIAPTICILLAGVAKYGERTRALYLASLENLRKSILRLPSPNPDDVLPNDAKPSVAADLLFPKFKGLIVDIMPSHQERLKSLQFFHNTSTENALEVISVELSRVYGELYTKSKGVYSAWGLCTRGIALSSCITALVLFYLAKKGEFHGVDVGVTYTLLAGAIFLDTDSTIILWNFDWSLPEIRTTKLADIVSFTIRILLMTMGVIASTVEIPLLLCGFGRQEKWSKRMGAFNLLDYCVKESRTREGGNLRRCYNFVCGKH